MMCGRGTATGGPKLLDSYGRSGLCGPFMGAREGKQMRELGHVGATGSRGSERPLLCPGNGLLSLGVLAILATWLTACEGAQDPPTGPPYAGHGSLAGGTGGTGAAGGTAPGPVPIGGSGGATGGATGPPFAGGTGGSAASGAPSVDAGAGVGGAAGLPAAGMPSGGTPGPALDAGEPPSTVDASVPDVPPAMDAGGAGDGAVVATGGTGGSTSIDAGPPPEPSGDAAQVCARWNADTADMSEGTWSGNVASCDPGDISAEGRANALRMINLFRWLADLPAIQTDPERDRKAQACALLMRANNGLSHDPPPSWACWTADGAEGAGNSNISTAAGVGAVLGYMIDDGNPTTIGHRRWILSNSIGPTGLGSTDRSSCMWTMGGRTNAGKPWVAWPPAGVMPFEAMANRWANTDSSGWTIQSDTINLSGAQVTVTSDGTPLQVTVTQLMSGYGSRYAIRFNPQGWQTQAGKIYVVTVSGVSQPISYQVEVADCG